MKKLSIGILWVLLSAAGPCVQAADSALAPADLRCEYTRNPLGVDTLKPRLSWKLETSAPAPRGQKQSAYRLLVASSLEILRQNQGDLWDSGRVASDQSQQVAYEGNPLHSAQQLFWKVQVWDQAGGASRWSDPAQWTMGLLKPEDWRAQWITAEPFVEAGGTNRSLPLFRRAFAVSQPLRRAVVFVCGLGFYELHLNGRGWATR